MTPSATGGKFRPPHVQGQSLSPAAEPIAPPLRYLAAEEFNGLGYYSDYEAIPLPPLSAADYPRLLAGDLALTRHKGSFLRPCPATPLYNCCGLNIFHIGQGCFLGCRYCVLAAYLGSAATIRFGNFPEGLSELTQILKAIDQAEPDSSPLSGDRSYRFCTGEFTDSLIYDQGLGVSERLIYLFKAYPKCSLELKTKTANVSHLLNLDHGGRTVLAFSVNAPHFSAKLEPLAAPLASRLAAAGQAAQKGYPIGIHFDPILSGEGWREGYRKTVELVDRNVPWDRIAWISLGCVRYQAPLKNQLLNQSPSNVFDEEFVRAEDGKFRYPRPLRYLLYGTILQYLKPHLDPKTTVYFCMESGRTWRDLMGFDPGTFGLTARFREPHLSKPWTNV
jgi:spore photoproduct lyase